MRIIDLTLPIADSMAVHPGDPPVRVRQVHNLGSHGWRLQEICLGSHTGTHLNAPWHMAEDGLRLEELPLTRFVAQAVVRTVRYTGLDAVSAWGRDELRGKLQNYGPLPTGLGLVYADRPLDAHELSLVLAARPPFVAQAVEFPMDEAVERELCRAGIPSFENLANTRELPRDETFLFVGLPLAIGGDGAPVRAIALVGCLE